MLHCCSIHTMISQSLDHIHTLISIYYASGLQLSCGIVCHHGLWLYLHDLLFLQPEQLTKIFELCGTPDDTIWPGVTKMPWYNNFKPPRPLKRRVKEFFKQWVIHDIYLHQCGFWFARLLLILLYNCSFDRHALELLEKMLTLDPAQVCYFVWILQKALLV